MSETGPITKTKSNAPWILGIVGFGLSIPQAICSILCAGVAAGAVQAANGATGEEVANAGATGAFFMLPAILAFTCFILSFFGKSKISTATGVLLIILGIVDAYVCFVTLAWLGIAAAICYACAGISSICNSKKLKA